jgi:hypothetical protein
MPSSIVKSPIFARNFRGGNFILIREIFKDTHATYQVSICGIKTNSAGIWTNKKESGSYMN